MMTSSEKSLQDLLDNEKEGKLISKKVVKYFVILAIALGIVTYFWRSEEDNSFVYKTEEVKLGSLTVTVSATGKLTPTNQIEVGSELSGIIESVFVDENDVVESGQVLAQLDTAKLNDAVEKSQAALIGQQASVAQALATLAETRTNLYRLRQLYELSDGEIPSQSQIDTAVANLRRAQADEKSSNAAVQQAEANLRSDKTNLSKATLISPIDGVVLKRSVASGQTVAASFQAPVLFTIAEDLRKMELHVDVDEADVGSIVKGQNSYFTVDAWPDRQYSASIHRVSFAADNTDDVVTYPTILDVVNTDLSLRPGMTGTAVITTLNLENQILVPNAVFRLNLSANIDTVEPKKSVFGFLFPRSKKPKREVHTEQKAGLSKLWVLSKDGPTEIAVEIIATNQKYSAVLSDQLKIGSKVITSAIKEDL